MGLLGKAITRKDANAEDAATGDIPAFISGFYRKYPQFHVVVLQGRGEIISRIAYHGGAVADLSDENSLVLLPGALDRELFTHRLCLSTGLTALSQMSADSPSLALETLGPFLR